MIKLPPVKVIIKGKGTVTKNSLWRCKKCGRDFKLPKIPKTCEEFWSICMTCFAVSQSVHLTSAIQKKP